MLRLVSTKDESERKPAVISFRAQEEMDADLTALATKLEFRSKSDLLHATCEALIFQTDIQDIPVYDSFRIKQTIEHVLALAALWAPDPSNPTGQRTDRRMHRMIQAVGKQAASKERAA